MRRMWNSWALAIVTLLLAVPVMAAPPSATSTASLTVIQVIADDPDAPFAGRGRIDFQSDPYKGQVGSRILMWNCYASWWPHGPTEADNPPIDRKTGTASVYFRNGTNLGSGTPYCETWEAWVALKSDPFTPISPVVTGP